MGFFDGLLGNASEVDPKQAQTEFAQIYAPSETVQKAYILIRDFFIFTDKRLILECFGNFRLYAARRFRRQALRSNRHLVGRCKFVSVFDEEFAVSAERAVRVDCRDNDA